MARHFDDNSGGAAIAEEFLKGSSTNKTSWQGTMACWCYPTSTSAGCVMGAKSDENTDAWHQLLWQNETCIAQTNGGGGANTPICTNTGSINTWIHLSTTSTSDGECTAFINGGDKTTESGSTISDADGWEYEIVGARPAATPAFGFPGHVAIPCWWTVVLDDAEILALANGAHPLTIRPQNIHAFSPLDGGAGNDRDIIGNIVLAEGGTIGTVLKGFEPPLHNHIAQILQFPSVAAGPSGRIMSSLARHGGLAGAGGIAGKGGGLAG